MDDGETFNGSIGVNRYIVNSVVASIFGTIFGTATPFIGNFVTTGSLALTSGEVAGAAVSGTVAAVGISSVVGMVFFASDKRPGNNKKQNEQFKSAMRELGISNKDVMRRIHDNLRGKNFGYKQLVEFIKEFLNLPMSWNKV